MTRPDFNAGGHIIFVQPSCFCMVVSYVTGFAKRGLPHKSILPTLTIHNIRSELYIWLDVSTNMAK